VLAEIALGQQQTWEGAPTAGLVAIASLGLLDDILGLRR
jgi:hypothetical protein